MIIYLLNQESGLMKTKKIKKRVIIKNKHFESGPYVKQFEKLFQRLPLGRTLYCKVPLVFHNGPTSNHRAGLILRWDQLQSEASWFTALPEAALYTTTFYRDFQALKGRLSGL